MGCLRFHHEAVGLVSVYQLIFGIVTSEGLDVGLVYRRMPRKILGLVVGCYTNENGEVVQSPDLGSYDPIHQLIQSPVD